MNIISRHNFRVGDKNNFDPNFRDRNDQRKEARYRVINNVKRIVSTFAGVAAALALTLCQVGAVGSPNGAFNWYCMRNADHRQPVCDPSMRFIEDYDGYYVDHRYGDDCKEKVIYLTFDAGYENGNVEKVLDVLGSEGVKGSFFILSHLVKSCPELVQRMTDEGHAVCNHTSKHKDMTKYHSAEEFAAELRELEQIYKTTTGKEMFKIYRPPEGRFSEENLKIANELGYKTVFWSFAYADWDNANQPDPDIALKKILDNVHNGEIMLLHPTSETNVRILGSLIRELKAKGYSFRTVNSLGDAR